MRGGVTGVIYTVATGYTSDTVNDIVVGIELFLGLGVVIGGVLAARCWLLGRMDGLDGACTK